ncbi:carbohydrate ABC transporter permease [Paenibacillus mucilaginosus]|uniref:Binding-protein-dependent transport systems inner membrane component n=3 Tax=Paenibacillus mucilaginosus TaxID=61624 RepID=H6N9E0_9BACL|nr:sugar ABC transporter permease [Paenibacillus mucilaginosus]AEI42142.1 binding-protein-dependent transport systems inner membrane component [Paenibacillus mucilaginosus KNP414]AFC27946.1 binding-protein-dependent transport systems inner membrane component [Paenibacillus mucilaginosus 3016]AFH60101.1 ABC transporter permease [Paenibacillus mucilaginosus K02]MCG7214119.1 sugar ABC transporter permease [Paenibacillus mucilaginosus]WDM28640.1 sugar ABC transporter permease [Paenibacillus mucila
MIAEKGRLNRIRTRLLFTGPTLFAFTTVMILPFVFGIYLTFTNWDGISTELTFVAFENYVSVFQDTEFWKSFYLTLKFVGATVVGINVVAFGLAYLLTSGLKGQSVFRAGFFVPNLIGGIVLGFIWQFIFSNVLVYLGKTYDIGLFRASWLSTPDKALWALIIVTVWQYAGYMMVIYVAGLMNVPKDILEAASIDGASGWTRLRRMVLPMIVPSFIVCIFLSLQRGFLVYDVNFALTKGGPFKSTEMVAMHVYEKAFRSHDYGVGQAEAFILFLLVTAVTLVQVYFSKKMEVEA